MRATRPELTNFAESFESGGEILGTLMELWGVVGIIGGILGVTRLPMLFELPRLKNLQMIERLDFLKD